MVNGDDCLSSYDHKLWSLHQHVIFKFNCYTVFKYHLFSVPQHRNSLIEWFVPRDHPLSYEVAQFLEQELAHERSEATKDYPGSDVNIMVTVTTFSGLEPYLEYKHLEGIAKQVLQKFVKDVKKMQKKQGEL